MKTYDDPTVTYDQADVTYDGYDWFVSQFKPLSFIKKTNIESGINKLEPVSNSKKDNIISKFK